MSYLKKTLKDLREERKSDVPLPVYIFWWVVRILMIIAAFDLMREGSTDFLPMCVNIFVCFMFTLFKLFPKEKFIFSRLSFKTETVVIVLNFVTTYLGSYQSLYFTMPSWDIIIHFFGGLAGVYFGYEVTAAALKKQKDLSPVVGAICGVGWCSWGAIVWEIYEFIVDQLTARDTQHWRYPGSNFELVPITDMARYALYDTMTDLIAGFVGSMIGGVLVYIWMAKKQRNATAVPEEQEKAQALYSNG